VAQGPVAVPAGTAASKGPAVPAVRPVRALAPAARKRRAAGEWPATAPAAVPARAPTTAAAAKVPAEPTTGPTGALALTAMKGGPTGGWGRTTAVAPTGGGGGSLKGGDGRRGRHVKERGSK
jgi:hypothetical protein